MTREKTFHLNVVTPEGQVLDVDAISVVFPAHDGEYGILPNHAPLLSLVGIGELRVTEKDGSTDRLYVDGGFAQFADNRLTLLTEQAKPVEHLDPEDPERLLEWAHKMRAGREVEEAVIDAAYERARVQKWLIEKRKGR